MRKLSGYLAVAVSAVLVLCPVCVHADSAVEEAETKASEEEDSPWWAGLQGVLEQGGEALSEVLGEEGIIMDVLDKADGEIGGAAGGILSLITGKDGSDKLSSLLGSLEGIAGNEELLGSLGELLGDEKLVGVLGELLGDEELLGSLEELLGEDGLAGIEELMSETAAMRDAAKDFILNLNASSMEPGDVQILIDSAVSDSDLINGAANMLTCFIQQNFTEDEDHVLHFLCEKKDVALVTVEETEDGGFTVSDAAFAEEGDDYEATLEEFLTKVSGDSLEECLQSIDFSIVYDVPGTLAQYMEENPEIAGIEFEGEICTADELRAIRDRRMYEFFGLTFDEPEEESEAEEASEPEE